MVQPLTIPSPTHTSSAPIREQVLQRLLYTAKGAALAVMILGFAGLCGALMGLPLLGSLFPGLIPMTGHAGIAFVILGAGLWCSLDPERGNLLQFIARLAALAVLLISLIGLGYRIMGQTMDGIPLWPRGEILTFQSGVTFVIAALALLLVDYPDRKRHPAQWLAVGVTLSGFWTLLQWLFNFGGDVPANEIAARASLNTALSFIIFGIGILLARPTAGAMAIFSSSSAAGQMARRILPIGTLLLFIIGTVTTLGQRGKFYDPALSGALFTLGSILLLTALIWRNAGEIDKTEREREDAEEAARRQREWLQVMLSSIADAVIATDQKGNIQFLNRVAHSLTGWAEREAVGRPVRDVFRLMNIKTGQELECPTERVLRYGEITGHPDFVTLVTRKSNRVPIEDKSAPIRDSNGQLIGCVIVFRDVTDRQKADEMRREVARQYATVAEAIPQMVWTAQADGSVDFFNQRWREYTGLELKRSSGWLWLHAFHEEDRPRCDEAWRHSIASGSRFEVAGRICQTDGSNRWHLIRALPVIDHHGRITKWFGTCTDIDDQKRAEEAMRFLADASTILSASQDEISTLQSVAELAVPEIADLCTVHLSGPEEGAEELLQLAAVSHMDPKRVELMVEIDRRFPPATQKTKGVTHILRTRRSELVPEFDHWLLDAMSANGEHRELLDELGIRSSMMVPLMGHRQILGVISFFSLESGRRFTPADLSLAEEVARRTTLALENNRLLAEITDTKEEAEAANAAKDQFLAVLSHELRTPLTPVLLAVEELVHDPDLTPEVRNVIEMTRRNIELEARLIDDLLDLTRIQRGKLQLQKSTIDAHALLRSSLEICNGDIENKGLCITLNLNAMRHHVHADPARLQQVFWNLIKNSVKFTTSGGSITFRSHNDEQGRLTVEVEDTGIGIEAEMLSRVFNAFEQGEKSRGRQFGGLGLGLAITKSLVEVHGGTINVDSPGRDMGTTFTVLLETHDAPTTPQRLREAPQMAADNAAGLRILLVEDNADTGALLKKILLRRGYKVELATSVGAALQVSKQQMFELLISDIGLPDGSGLQLMEALSRTRPIPGIAMSGFGMDEDIRRSREAGFSEHLTKPVSVAKLEEALAKLTASLQREG